MTDDLISRQAVDEIKELMTDINGDTVYAVRMSYIRQLPPVNPQEPKTGHWIKAKPWMLDYTSYKWECSECEKSERFRHNYCPNCGARMIEPQESEEV